MRVKDLEKAFLALDEKEQLAFLKWIMPGFCRNMTKSNEKVVEMFDLFTVDCGKEMRNMFASMAPMMGPRRGGCCG